MNIILIEKEDKEKNDIVEKILKNYDDEFTKDIREDDVSFFLEKDKKIVGGLIGTVYGDYFEVGTLAISKEYRKHGYGQTLLKKAEAYAKEKSCQYILLYTTDYQGETYYPKFGYQEVLSIQDYPIKGKKVICFRKIINQKEE